MCKSTVVFEKVWAISCEVLRLRAELVVAGIVLLKLVKLDPANMRSLVADRQTHSHADMQTADMQIADHFPPHALLIFIT